MVLNLMVKTHGFQWLAEGYYFLRDGFLRDALEQLSCLPLTDAIVDWIFGSDCKSTNTETCYKQLED